MSKKSVGERSEQARRAWTMVKVVVETLSGDRSRVAYNTYLEVNGELSPLCEGTQDPEPDSCRVLLERGIQGGASFWKKGGSLYLLMEIKWGAGHRTTEGEKVGPKFVKHYPPSPATQDAVSTPPTASQAAI